jgi:hypothetical protein
MSNTDHLLGGYKEAELQAAFDTLANKENWKLPISAVIQQRDFAVHDYAAVFFTGGHLTIHQQLSNGFIEVRGNGYYHHIGS